MKTLLLSIITLLSFNVYAQQCKQIIGYYPGWQWYDRAQLVKPSTIKYNKYTIINYAFFEPQPNGNITGADAWADENILKGQINWSTNPPSYYPNTSLVDLAHNNNVKVLISVGGWTFSNNFPSIAADPVKRANFAHNCRYLCEFYNLDGIDIDWEYPGYAEHNGTPADKQNYTILLRQIRDSLNAYQTASGKTMLLTSCIGASRSNMSNVEWNNISAILTYINLMSYDFFGSWDLTANHNSPLYAPLQGDSTYNLSSAVNYLLTNYSVPANKLTAGIAFYGRSAKTTVAPNLFVPISGVDYATFPEDEGQPLYYNIMKKYNLFTEQWDNTAKVPYLTGNGSLKTFVSYDNPASVALKAQYINSKNLAGAIVWEITGDYIETFPGSGMIAGTPLADTLKAVFCAGSTFCNAPTSLNTTTIGINHVALTWSNTGAVKYYVQHKKKSDAAWPSSYKEVTGNTTVIRNLSPCTEYQVRVNSVCNGNTSGYTNAIEFKTSGCQILECETPTGLYASAITGTSAGLNWNNSGATSYTLQYKKTSDAGWTTQTVSTTNYNLTTLTQCTGYQFRVKGNCVPESWSPVFSFTTGGCTPSTCSVTSPYFFDSVNYIPLGEIKLGQGRLYELWGVTADAYIPGNRVMWAISMVHAHHLFRNITKADKIPLSFYFATALKESFCGCDSNMQAYSSPFPLAYNPLSVPDGCFQIESISAYGELVNMFPSRFPVGQHSRIISGDNFETAALSKAYYDIFAVKFLEVSRGWNPVGFFNNASDPSAAVKLMAIAYNRGLWYPDLGTVLNTDRTNAINSTNISSYFTGSGYGFDYQKVLTQYCNVLENKANLIDPSLVATNPATGLPYNYFGNYYNPNVTWSNINAYIDSIAIMYPDVNINNLKTLVQNKFNSINSGNPISFRYNLGAVLDVLIKALPADDPTTKITTAYGCALYGTMNANDPSERLQKIIPNKNKNTQLED